MAITRDTMMCFVAALSLSAALGLAVPMISPSLVPRLQACNNAPTTTTARTQVYVLLTQSGAIHTVEVMAVLGSAWQTTSAHLATVGDGLLPGEFFVQFHHVMLRVWNANNHQTTWGVLNAAILSLIDFLTVKQGIGAVVFKIFDGDNQVAQGSIAYAP